MTLREQFVAIFREMRRSYDDLPRRIWMWLLRQHAPTNIGTDEAPHAWCFTCRKDWPCDEFLRLADMKDKHQRKL